MARFLLLRSGVRNHAHRDKVLACRRVPENFLEVLLLRIFGDLATAFVVLPCWVRGVFFPEIWRRVSVMCLRVKS